MSKPIEYQIIEHGGHSAYVLVPWEEWNRIKPLLDAERARASEQLTGDRAGQWSIRINNQWRICFSWEDGNAFDVEIVDYH